MTQELELSTLSKTDIAEIQNLSVQSLKEMLAKEVQHTSTSMLKIALIWRELENRGEDLSELKGGALWEFIPHVARGSLLPSTVVHFAGNKQLLRAITYLDHDIQRRLISGEAIPVVTLDKKGEPKVRHFPAALIPKSSIGTAFAGTMLRPVEEQRKMEQVKATKRQLARTKHVKQGIVNLLVEREHNRIYVGHTEVDLDKLLVALQEAGFTLS